MRIRLAFIAGSLAFSACSSAQAQTAAPDDLDCLLTVMTATTGGHKDLEKPGLSPADREEANQALIRLNRALGYFIAVNDARSRQPGFRTELEGRFNALRARSLDEQTRITMKCLARPDEAMGNLLARAK